MTTPATTVQDTRSTSRSEGRTKDMKPVNDIIALLREYAQEKPEAAALWCLGIGFVLGWKLKPW
jgi:hypothetical protein